ncbi:hypothetical protein, partial [Streptomyces sp. adm13(2018)]|uniref:hypothetical protein n=1 Tax=Streptomyces sp. adm13(2018) TaxID=2479007 RepID=UPI001C9C9A6C
MARVMACASGTPAFTASLSQARNSSEGSAGAPSGSNAGSGRAKTSMPRSQSRTVEGLVSGMGRVSLG